MFLKDFYDIMKVVNGEEIMRQASSSRRRGDRLTESIYEATIEIIRTEGYTNLTFQKIARLAKTSRTVLYRRWATPLDMIHEMIAYRSSQTLDGDLADKIKDTGSLRGDLLHLVTLYQKIYVDVSPEIMSAVLFEMSRNNPQIKAIKNNAVFQNIKVIEKIPRFAKARGEKIKTLSKSALTLPFDLIRISNLWGQGVLNQSMLEHLVDEILLPVFKG